MSEKPQECVPRVLYNFGMQKVGQNVPKIHITNCFEAQASTQANPRISHRNASFAFWEAWTAWEDQITEKTNIFSYTLKLQFSNLPIFNCISISHLDFNSVTYNIFFFRKLSKKETGMAVRFIITFILTIKISFIFIFKSFLFWKLYNSRTTYNSELMWLGRFFSQRLENMKGVLNKQWVLKFLLLFSC